MPAHDEVKPDVRQIATVFSEERPSPWPIDHYGGGSHNAMCVTLCYGEVVTFREAGVVGVNDQSYLARPEA
jgi:hypothetical protein